MSVSAHVSPAMEKKSLSRKSSGESLDDNDDRFLPPLSSDEPRQKKKNSFHRDDDSTLPAIHLSQSREKDGEKKESLPNVNTDDTLDRFLLNSPPFPSHTVSGFDSSPSSSVHGVPNARERKSTVNAGEEKKKTEGNAEKERSGSKETHDEDNEPEDKAKQREKKQISSVSTSPENEDDMKKGKRKGSEGMGAALETAKNVLSPSKTSEDVEKYIQARRIYIHQKVESPYKPKEKTGREKTKMNGKEPKKRRIPATSPPPPPLVLHPPTVSTTMSPSGENKGRSSSRSSSSSNSSNEKHAPFSHATTPAVMETTPRAGRPSSIDAATPSPSTITTTSHLVVPTPLSTPTEKKEEAKKKKKTTSPAFRTSPRMTSSSPPGDRKRKPTSVGSDTTASGSGSSPITTSTTPCYVNEATPSPPSLGESKRKKKKARGEREHDSREVSSVMTATTTSVTPSHSTATTTKGKAGIKNPNAKSFVHHRLREEMQADFDKRSKASHREFLRLCRATPGSGLPSQPKSSGPSTASDHQDLHSVGKWPQDREGEGSEGHLHHTLSSLSSPSRSPKGMRVERSPVHRTTNSNPAKEWTTPMRVSVSTKLDSGPPTARTSRLASLFKEVEEEEEEGRMVDHHHHRTLVPPSHPLPSPLRTAHGGGTEPAPHLQHFLSTAHPEESGNTTTTHPPFPPLRHTTTRDDGAGDSMIFGLGTVGLAMQEQVKNAHAECGTGDGGGGVPRRGGEEKRGITGMGGHGHPLSHPALPPVEATANAAEGNGNGGGSATTMNVFERLQRSRKAQDGRPPVFCAVAQEAFQKHQQECWEKQQAAGATVHAARTRLAKGGKGGPYHMLAPTTLYGVTHSREALYDPSPPAAVLSLQPPSSSSPSYPHASLAPSSNAPCQENAAPPPPPPALSSSSSAERPFTVSEFMAVQRLVRFGMPLDDAAEAVRHAINPTTLSATISSLHSSARSTARQKKSLASSSVSQPNTAASRDTHLLSIPSSPSSKEHSVAGQEEGGEATHHPIPLTTTSPLGVPLPGRASAGSVPTTTPPPSAFDVAPARRRPAPPPALSGRHPDGSSDPAPPLLHVVASSLPHLPPASSSSSSAAAAVHVTGTRQAHYASSPASLPSTTSPAIASRPLGGLVNEFGYFSMHRAQPQYYMHLESIAGSHSPGDSMKLPSTMTSSSSSPLQKSHPSRRALHPPALEETVHHPSTSLHLSDPQVDHASSGLRLGSPTHRRPSMPGRRALPEEALRQREGSRSPPSGRPPAKRTGGRRYHGRHHTKEEGKEGSGDHALPPTHHRRSEKEMDTVRPHHASGILASPISKKDSYTSSTVLSSPRDRMTVTTSLPGSSRSLSFTTHVGGGGGGGHSAHCLVPLRFSDPTGSVPTAVSSDSTG